MARGIVAMEFDGLVVLIKISPFLISILSGYSIRFVRWRWAKVPPLAIGNAIAVVLFAQGDLPEWFTIPGIILGTWMGSQLDSMKALKDIFK